MNENLQMAIRAGLFGLLGAACFAFISCTRTDLPENPDIRSYMAIARKDVPFDVVKNYLPKNMIVKEKHLSKDETIPSYPGNTYYFSTDRNYSKMIRIEEKGKFWVYAGSFFFNRDRKCIAVQYEAHTSFASPKIPHYHWKPQEEFTE